MLTQYSGRKISYNIPFVYVEGIKEDVYIKNFIHCYLPCEIPIGVKHLWSISYDIKHINVKHEDSKDLLLELATINPHKERGEIIVSRIFMQSFYVLNCYNKMLSFEYQGRIGIKPLLQIRAFNKDLKCAFEELYPLIHGHEGFQRDELDRQVLDSQIFQRAKHKRKQRLLSQRR